MARILVVDDDPMVCVAIEVCLQRQGFDVTVADGADLIISYYAELLAKLLPV